MIVIKFILLLALVAAPAIARRSSGMQNAGQCLLNFQTPDHIILAVQWPPGVCHTSRRRCKSSLNQFTIHGAWPNYREGSGPAFCCGQPFHESLVGEQRPQLQTKWQTLFPGSSSSFWKHEWEKHGTCAKSPMFRGQQSYFNQTLSLFDKLDLLSWLQESGITARQANDGTYDAPSFQQAIEKHINGKRIRIDCKRSRKQRESVFVGVHICYDPVTLDFTDCVVKKSSCGQLKFIAPFISRQMDESRHGAKVSKERRRI